MANGVILGLCGRVPILILGYESSEIIRLAKFEQLRIRIKSLCSPPLPLQCVIYDLCPFV